MSASSLDLAGGAPRLACGPWFTATTHAPTISAVAIVETSPTAMFRHKRGLTFHIDAARVALTSAGNVGNLDVAGAAFNPPDDSIARGAVVVSLAPLLGA